MTAKEALRELVEDMSEEDAREAYGILAEIYWTPHERPPISAGEMQALREALVRLDAGEGLSHAEVLRRVGYRTGSGI